MEIFSSWYYDEDKTKKLTQDILFREVKRAENITIVSAYYSVEFLDILLRKVNRSKRKNCTINFVFNGFGGQRLYDQTNELEKLTSNLNEIGFQKISIYLNRKTTLFHSKLYFIKNNEGTIWFIGSANASKAGFGKNEELLVKLKTKIRNIQQYISDTITNSELIEYINPDETVESNIIGFFRTGSIYFKPYNHLSFTFSDFKLPDWVEEKIRNIEDRPRHTNPGKAWGSYNLKLSLGLKTDDDKDENVKLSLKPWSIETCYGYWVPNKYRYKVNESIKIKSIKTRRVLLEVVGLMANRGIDSLLEDYKNHIDDAKRILKSNNIEYHFDEHELFGKYRKFLERIVHKLSEPDRLDKLCSPLTSAGMPEIWEDNIAYKDFSESFYEYIASSLTGQIPRIVRSIMERLEFTSNLDSNEVAECFIKYFESNEAEWVDAYWRE